MAVEDADGRLLHGEAPAGGVDALPDHARRARASAGSRAAQTRGSSPRCSITSWRGEAEQKALGAEVLHLYREVNLIYSFSEKLAALLDLERVAALTLQRSAPPDRRHRRRADAARRGDGRARDGRRIRRRDCPRSRGFRLGLGIIGAVAATGVGEIVNDVDADPRRITEHPTVKALICRAAQGRRAGDRRHRARQHDADGLHGRRTEAAERRWRCRRATAIENARLFERTVQAAHERERLMALHQAAEVARAKLESELTLAARIQADLFPAALPSIAGYELAARNRPARRCGGDYYDALTLPPDRRRPARCCASRTWRARGCRPRW